MRRSAFVLAILLLIGAEGLPSVAFAQNRRADQQLRRFQYTAAINTLLGDRTSLDGLNDADLIVLGSAHLRRAYLLRDLAVLQAAVGATYYTMRDTSTAFEATPWNAYFLGRYLFEHGQIDRALGYFEDASKDTRLSEDYRTRARIWTAACHAHLGQSQQAESIWRTITVDGEAALAGEQAYARWKTGRNDVPACGADAGKSVAAMRCRLWVSIRTMDMPTLYALQRDLLKKTPSDRSASLGGDMKRRFFDPATLHMLADADFVGAMKAFERYKGSANRDGIILSAGVSAFEAGHYDRARDFFNQTNHPYQTVYLGALHYLDNNQDVANRLWTQVRSGNSNPEIEWASVASRFDTQHADVRTSARDTRSAVRNPQDARKLGRALLQIGRHQEALEVLNAVYPLQINVADIEPGYMVTRSHAQLLTELKQDYALVRGYFADLTDVYPTTISVYEVVRGYTLPERWKTVH